MFQDVPECFGMFHVPGFIDGHRKPSLIELVTSEESVVFNVKPA